MPAIPIYESQVGPSGGAALPFASPNAFGANIGSAVVKAGQDVEEGEDALHRAHAAADVKAQQRADDDAHADAAVKFAQFKADVEKAKAQARIDAEPGAPGHTDTVLKTFDAAAAPVAASITNRKAANWFREQLAETRGSIQTSEDTYEAGARAGKLTSDVSSTIDLEGNNLFTNPDPKEFGTTLKRVLSTVDAMTGIEEPDKEKLRNYARDEISLKFARGLAQKDPYAARQLLQSGQLNDFISKDHLPALNERIDGEIKGREAEQRRLEAEQRRQAADARREERERQHDVAERVRDRIDYWEHGGQPAPGEVKDTIAAAADSGRPELGRTAIRAGVSATVTAQFRTASPVDLRNHVSELEQKVNAAGAKASPAMLAELDASRTLLGNMTTELKRDPIAWASRAGTVKLAPIDWNDPNTMRARVSAGDATARHYGVEPQYLTGEEQAALSATLAHATPDQKLTIARNIATGFGPRAAQAIATLGQSGTFTHAAGLATYGGPLADVSRRIFVGQELAKTSTLIPQGDKINSLANDALGRSLAYQPQTRANAIAAANALYLERATRKGIKGRDEFDENLWRQGLNEALGSVNGTGGLYTPGTAGMAGYVRSNKPAIVLPVGMKPDRFDDLIYNITPAEVKAAGHGLPKDSQGRPISLSTFRGASLFSKGDGKYLVSLDRNGTQFLRGSGPNGYYVLDVKALDRIRK